MSSSPKNKRIPPINHFEDYALTYEVGTEAGLYPVSSKFMSYTTYGSYPYGVGEEYLNLGFDFKFDTITYRNIYVSSRGFAYLLDPEANPEYVLDGTLDSSSNNTSLFDSWHDKHVMLAPWWDSTTSVWRYPTDVTGGNSATDYLSALGISLGEVTSGKKTFPAGVDSQLGGIKYYSSTSKNHGRCFVIRWKNFSYSSGTSYNIIEFDLVLYENGTIEFRYAPRQFRQFEPNENATIGIFANGADVSSPRYRDLGYVVKKDSRGEYKNGAAVYNGSFTDTDGTTTKKYTVSLNTRDNWPGLDQAGAIFRFSPPTIRRRQNRTIMNLRDSISFTGGGTSYFNDQNTIPFTSQVVEYPTMLPVSLRTSYNSSQAIYVNELYSSGSIQVTRTISPGMFDAVLENALLDGKRRSGQ